MSISDCGTVFAGPPIRTLSLEFHENLRGNIEENDPLRLGKTAEVRSGNIV
jgi:hypothetical protein